MNWEDFKKHPIATFAIIALAILAVFAYFISLGYYGISGMYSLSPDTDVANMAMGAAARNRFLINILLIWCIYEFIIKKTSSKPLIKD